MKRSEIKRAPLKRAEPAAPKLRTRKCKVCRSPFPPRSMTHAACSPDCAAMLAAQQRAKVALRALRELKLAAKGRRDWEKEAQAAVNAWVRLVRDADKPCISCGRHHEGQNHAGHYLSRGARPGLRYVEANIAKQCMPCNVHLSGNQANFRLGLVNRIGLAAVEHLEADDMPRKYTIEQLREIRDDYRARLRAHNNKEKV